MFSLKYFALPQIILVRAYKHKLLKKTDRIASLERLAIKGYHL